MASEFSDVDYVPPICVRYVLL